MTATRAPAPRNGGDDAPQVLVNVGEYSRSGIPALSKNGKVALSDHPLLTPRNAAATKGHDGHHRATISPQLSRNFSQDHGE